MLNQDPTDRTNALHPLFTIERFVMLDNDFKEYLNDEFGRIFPESQEEYRKLFKELGFGEVNHDFIEFWATYSDEIYGKIGYLVDLAMDLEDFSSSQTEILRKILAYLIIIFPC